MPGAERKKMSKKIAVGDADSLIALIYKEDANHVRAKEASDWFSSEQYEIIYPNTAILEAIIALKRSLNLVSEAHFLNRQYLEGNFLVEFINEEIQRKASLRFEKTVSKKNTIFDCLVAEIALELKADYIFSFDKWYIKEGFNLIPST